MARSRSRVATRTIVVRQKRSRRRTFEFAGKRKIPLAIVAGVIPGLKNPIAIALHGEFKPALQRAVVNYTGYDFYQNNWNTYFLKEGLYPLLGGLAAHYLANMIGINRFIRKFKIPVEI